MNLLFTLGLHFVCYNERIHLIHYSIAKGIKVTLEAFEAPQRKQTYAGRVSCTGAPKYFLIFDLHAVVFNRKCRHCRALMRSYSRLNHKMGFWLRESCHTYCVCLGEKRLRPLLFSRVHFTSDAKEQRSEWMNDESNRRFKSYGRRAQEMTHLVIGWMLVHSNLSIKSEKVGGNIGGR